MQHLGIDLKPLLKEKIKEIELELKEIVLSHSRGEIFICPFCNYESSKNKKGSAKMFDNSFKCFNCGIWRAV